VRYFLTVSSHCRSAPYQKKAKKGRKRKTTEGEFTGSRQRKEKSTIGTSTGETCDTGGERGSGKWD